METRKSEDKDDETSGDSTSIDENQRCSRYSTYYKAVKKSVDLITQYVLLPLLIYIALVSLFRQDAFPPSTQCLNSKQPARNVSNSSTVIGVPCSSGTIFGVYMIVLLGIYAGLLVRLIGLPPLLGMLCAGVLLRNLPYWPLASAINPRVSGALRKAAFVVILIEGGLGLDIASLRKLKLTCIRLAALPCAVEALTVAVASVLLFQFSFVNGLLLGFSLGAVSPAIVVPSMLSLTNKRLGVSTGIPTLVIAASSIDDVFAITSFSVLLSLAFGKSDNILSVIGMCVVELIVGVLYGVLAGLLVGAVPNNTSSSFVSIRLSVLMLLAVVCMFGSAAVHLDGSGALGCLLMALVANIQWSRQQQHKAALNSSVRSAVSFLWRFPFEPLLFGLIGAELDLTAIDINVIGKTVLVVLIGVTLRTLAAFVAVIGAGFTAKERLFISLSWLPKATVQAALAPVFYDTALESGLGPKELETGIIMMSVAVLSILLTAPLGTVLMALTAHKLVRKDDASTNDDETEMQNTALFREDPLSIDKS